MLTQSQILIMAGLFVVIYFFGFWLRRSGKPYGSLLFNIHKLLALAALVFLIFTVYQLHQAVPLGAAAIIAMVLTVLFFVISIITGGLLNLELAMYGPLLLVHKIVPHLTVVSTALTLYLVQGHS